MKFTQPDETKKIKNNFMYEIKTTQFEGPFDLLLGLIEKRKLSINDVSLSDISGQYLDYLKQIQKFPLEEVAVFAVIASTLMLIKSRSLMPSMQLTQEEEESIEELEKRLKIYRRIRQLSVNLENLFGESPLFGREGTATPVGEEIGFIEPKGATIKKLHSLLREIIKNFPVKECLAEVQIRKIINIEEKIKELVERIRNSFILSFSEFSISRSDIGTKDKKIEIIVSFLAMLELVKQGLIMVNQKELFANIRIKGNGKD